MLVSHNFHRGFPVQTFRPHYTHMLISLLSYIYHIFTHLYQQGRRYSSRYTVSAYHITTFHSDTANPRGFPVDVRLLYHLAASELTRWHRITHPQNNTIDLRPLLYHRVLRSASRETRVLHMLGRCTVAASICARLFQPRYFPTSLIGPQRLCKISYLGYIIGPSYYMVYGTSLK